MKHTHLLPLLLPLAGLASAAEAAPCDVSGYVVSPDLLTYSVPGLGLAAFEGAPASCGLVIPIQGVTGDTVSLFAASYSGELTEGTGARLTVEHNGLTDTDDIVGEPGGSFGELATGTVFARGDTLQSDFTAEITDPVGDDEFDFDTADYVLLSRADLFDISIARTGVVTQLNGTAELLSGAGQPEDEGDGITALGGIGSVTVGVSGHKALDNGLSVHGGIAYLDQHSAGASASGVLLSGGIRYTAPENGQLYRPYFELGVHAAPGLSTRFGLNYTTLTTTVSTSAETDASFYGGYLEGGVLVAPTPDDDIVLSAKLGSDVLSTDAFTTGGGAVFAVTQPEQSNRFTTIRAGVDYTRRLNERASVTLTGAVGRTFGSGDVTSTIDGAGTFTTASASETFGQYGARLTYALSDTTDVSAFVFGTSGELSGTHTQIGASAKVKF